MGCARAGKGRTETGERCWLGLFAGWVLAAVWVILSGTAAVGAQEAPRVTAATVQELMGRVVVTYTLEGSRAARVRLLGLVDGTAILRTRAVSGAVGEGVLPGAGRALHWDIPADHPGGLGDRAVSLSVVVEPVEGARVVFVPIRGLFGIGFTEAVFAECLEAAGDEQAQVLVAEFDSPGGDPRVAEAAAERFWMWRKSRPNLLAVAYVSREASGVAAPFAAVFDELYLAPQATFGGPTAAEDAELLAGARLEAGPSLHQLAQRWAENHGIAAPLRSTQWGGSQAGRYTGQEAVANRLAAGLADDRDALGKRLHYTAWEDRSQRVAQLVEQRHAAVRAAADAYDVLAALIDEELKWMEQANLGPAKHAAYTVLELAAEAAALSEEFPFVEGLFNQEFPGGLAAVTRQCREVTGEAAEETPAPQARVTAGRSGKADKRAVKWPQIRRQQRPS